MIIASHVIFGTYGFWLPNDPRGSGSDFIGSWDLYQFGPATKTDSRHSVAAAPHDVEARLAAKQSLKYPAVVFNGLQARAVGRGFAEYVRSSGLTFYACAILPDHIHLVIARFRLQVETVVNFLKGAATKRLEEEGLHPLARFPRRRGHLPKAFGRGEWKVFLDSPADVVRAVRYVEQNPIKAGLPAQRWSFVQPYDPAR